MSISCITPTFGSSTSPQLQLSIETTAETATNQTFSWWLDLVFHGYAASSSVQKSYSAYIAGELVASGSMTIGGITGTKRIASGTKVINRTTSGQTLSMSCSMAFNITWSGVYGGTKSASNTFYIGPKTSYTVSYNANGGSGAPGSQTKWHGTNITLSTGKPTRTGYIFQGWATSASGGVSYQPGATYSNNASATLYAVWKAITYTVSYNANGGSGAPSSQTKTYGVNLTLSSTRPTRTNYNFLGWGVSASSTTVLYSPGSTYSENVDITLYAIWSLAYTPPRIEILECYRTIGSAIPSDEGEYVQYKVKWETDKNATRLNSAFRVQNSGSSFTTMINHTLSGTSGTVAYEFSMARLSAEKAYEIQFTVTDSMGSSSVSTILQPMTFIIDLLKGGKGITFGKPASEEGFNVGMTAKFEKKIYDDYGTRINNGLANYTGSASSAIDPDTTLDELIVTDKNTPMSGSFMYIHTMFYGSKSTTTNRAQYALPYNKNGSMYHRYYSGGTWTSWRRHVNEDEITNRFTGIGSSQSLPNRPSGATNYYRCMTFDYQTGSSADKYYLFIDSNGKLWTGRQLNGASTITWAEK